MLRSPLFLNLARMNSSQESPLFPSSALINLTCSNTVQQNIQVTAQDRLAHICTYKLSDSSISRTPLCKTVVLLRSNVHDHVLHQSTSKLFEWFYRTSQTSSSFGNRNDCMPRHLEKHADDGHHCKPSVGKFSRQFLGFLCGIG